MAEDLVSGMIPKIDPGSLLNSLFWILLVIIILGTIGFLAWYVMYQKKYNQYIIEILDKDSNGNVYRKYDKGGVFKDKTTGNILLFLQKAKIGMDPSRIPYISSINRKGRLIKTVTLRKIGEKNYVYVDIKLGDAPKYTIGEEDLNNYKQEIAKIRRTYAKEGWLNKLAPYITFIITIIIIMVILISLFNKFEVMESISKNMLEVTEQQAKITSDLYNLTRASGGINQIPIIRPGG